MLSSNTSYTLYTRADNSHLIMDTSFSWQVLDKHLRFLDITKNPEDGYYYYINKKFIQEDRVIYLLFICLSKILINYSATFSKDLKSQHVIINVIINTSSSTCHQQRYHQRYHQHVIINTLSSMLLSTSSLT